eukprot:779115_1
MEEGKSEIMFHQNTTIRNVWDQCFNLFTQAVVKRKTTTTSCRFTFHTTKLSINTQTDTFKPCACIRMMGENEPRKQRIKHKSGQNTKNQNTNQNKNQKQSLYSNGSQIRTGIYTRPSPSWR